MMKKDEDVPKKEKKKEKPGHMPIGDLIKIRKEDKKGDRGNILYDRPRMIIPSKNKIDKI